MHINLLFNGGHHRLWIVTAQIQKECCNWM